MERTGLINLVKVKMDEYTPAGVSLPFDQTIGPLLDEAAIDVLRIGPKQYITPTAITLTADEPPVSNVKYADNKAYIPFPADYVRLYSLKYPAWKKTVREAISEDSQQYSAYENEYLTPGNGRPYVAIVQRKLTGDSGPVKYLECCRVEDPGVEALVPSPAFYVKECLPEALNDIFADCLSWLTASKVFGVLGYEDKAKSTNDRFLAALTTIV